MGRLKLDGEGRYIQGPAVGKVALLLHHGAKRRPMPRKFPLGPGRQLVCVVVNGAFDAALWIQDEIDFQRCRTSDTRLKVWLEIGNDPLFQADRDPIEMRSDDGRPQVPVGARRLVGGQP